MSPRTASTLRWTALALAGLAIAIVVGVAAGKLTSQQIGLSSEPIQAGEALAPKPTNGGGGKSGSKGGKKHGGSDHGGSTTTSTTVPTTTVPTTTTPTTPTTTPTPVEPTTTGDNDDSGGGEGSDDD